MPINPIDGHDHSVNPFERSKLFKAAAVLQRPEPTPAPPVAKAQPVSGWPSRDDNHFSISTHQILNLMQRYRIRNFTFQELQRIPLSQLNPAEKDFVNYLRRNPGVFNQLSSLDNDPSSLSEQDIKIAAQLAGDALVLSDVDLRYLRQSPLPSPASARPTASAQQQTPQGRLQTQDLLNTLNKLIPEGKAGIPYGELVSMAAIQSGLKGRELESLRFMQTTTVSKVLQKVAQPYDGLITPDVLRVLTSLLWNPSIYGAAPIVFFKSGPSHADYDEESVHGVDEVEEVDDNKHDSIRPTRQRPSWRLEAHHLHEILHNISEDGHATLQQIRRYEPRNGEEEKAINLLRQSQVFELLANLDHHPESLSDEDIRLALAEGAFVLSDPYMVLVILP